MAREINCPKCGVDISESYEPADFSVGIMGSGWYCDACDLAVEDNGYSEPFGDEVPIFGEIGPDVPKEPLGTPLSEISTQPGTPGYAEWLRISKSWGRD